MLLLGNFWKKLGYFLFQHLVTLSVAQQCSNGVPLKSLSIIHLMLVSFVLNFCVQNVNRLLNGQVNNIITSTN